MGLLKRIRTADPIALALVAIILILPLLIFYFTLQTVGPSWDLTVRYLLGKTLLNFFTHNVSPRVAFAGEFSNNLLYYFEPYREPLSTPIFAVLLLFFEDPILPYMVLIYAGYLLAVYKLSKELGIGRLVAFSVMVNSYVVYFFFVPNGGEGLSIIMVFAGLFYLLRKNPVAGLFLGLAGLAKYPAIAMLPLVLLLDSNKKRLYALALGLIPLLAWGGLDYALYGVPFYSYAASISAAGVATPASTIYGLSILQVVCYPALFAAFGFALLLIKKAKIKIRFDYRTKVIVSSLALAGICYLLILPHNDPFTQQRYGFLFSAALLVPAAVILGSAIRRYSGRNLATGRTLLYVVMLIAIVPLSYALYSSYAGEASPAVLYYNPNNPDGIYAFGGNAIASVGFGGCRFITNAWVPMIYSGYDAYSPFILYTSNVITPDIQSMISSTPLSAFGGAANAITETRNGTLTRLNYTAYVDRQERYPILVFKYTGVPASFIANLNSSKMAYDSQNISVYLPPNATCYSD